MHCAGHVMLDVWHVVMGCAALAINEFLAPRWSRFADVQGQAAGIAILRSHGAHLTWKYMHCSGGIDPDPKFALTDMHHKLETKACPSVSVAVFILPQPAATL